MRLSVELSETQAMISSIPPLWQTLGNICIGIAAFVVLVPLHRLLGEYAGKFPSDNQWVPAALSIVSPLWLLLLGALLSMTGSGGFDWLRFGRPVLYVLTVASAVALAGVSFVSIAMYIRPGFTPRGLYVPVIYLVPSATMLLVVLSLNPTLVPGISTTWLRVPWTIFAAVSLVACVGVVGQQTLSGGMRGVRGVASRLRNPGPSFDEILAHLATLDPQRDFAELLKRTGPGERRAVNDAVIAVRCPPHSPLAAPPMVSASCIVPRSHRPSSRRLRCRRARRSKASRATFPHPTTCLQRDANSCYAGGERHFP